MLVFDTYKFYEQLEKSGFTREQAETVTNLIKDTQEHSFGEMSKELATKQDTSTLNENISTLKDDILDLKHKVEIRFNNSDLKNQQTKYDMIKWYIGGMFTVLIFNTGLIVTIFKLLNK